MTKRTFFSAAVALASLATTMYGETLANWDFSGQNGLQDETAAQETASGLKVSGLIRGTGLDKRGGASEFTADGMAFWPGMPLNTEEEAIEANAYFEVTLTPEEGRQISIRSISFAVKRATRKSGPINFVVRTSTDNFGSDAAGPLKTEVPEGGDVTVSFGSELTQLKQPVTLRFYGFGRGVPDYPKNGVWVILNSPLTKGFTIEGQVN